jgi:insertion element IS1 protein InsB
MNCNYCEGICKKKGVYKNVQKYRCSGCNRYQRGSYRNRRYTKAADDQITLLNREGVGISSISRLLSIPKASVQRRMARSAGEVRTPVYQETNEVYEVDELYTYIGRKSNPCYIVYAINRKTNQVIDFVCGARTKENIEKVIKKLPELVAQKDLY